jgi:long-chain acyl-CoA synthetase
MTGLVGAVDCDVDLARTEVVTDIPLADALAATARRFPDRVALVTESRRLSYRLLDDEVTTVAAGLRRLGLFQWDAVALLLSSSWEAIRGILAVARAGGIAVPLDPTLEVSDLWAALQDVLPAWILADIGDQRADLQAFLYRTRTTSSYPCEVALGGSKVPSWAHGLEELMSPSGPVTIPPAAVEADDVVAIFPQMGVGAGGAIHSHRNLLESARTASEVHGSPEPQAWMVLLPTHTLAGLRVVLAALLAGHQLVLPRQTSPEEALKLIERERVNILVAGPDMLDAMHSIGGCYRADSLSLVIADLPADPPLSGAARTSAVDEVGDA